MATKMGYNMKKVFNYCILLTSLICLTACSKNNMGGLAQIESSMIRGVLVLSCCGFLLYQIMLLIVIWNMANKRGRNEFGWTITSIFLTISFLPMLFMLIAGYFGGDLRDSESSFLLSAILLLTAFSILTPFLPILFLACLGESDEEREEEIEEEFDHLNGNISYKIQILSIRIPQKDQNLGYDTPNSQEIYVRLRNISNENLSEKKIQFRINYEDGCTVKETYTLNRGFTPGAIQIAFLKIKEGAVPVECELFPF